MKLFIPLLTMCITFSAIAENLEFDFGLILPAVKEVAVDQSSREKVMERISKEYMNKGNWCGVIYPPPSPDEILKHKYNKSLIRDIVTFTQTTRVYSYTPIRQLVNNPIRPAIFDGYYFVSQ